MKKIKSEYDNIFDTRCYDIADLLSSTFRYLQFTPNMITYLNIIMSILSIYYLFYENYNLGVLFLVIRVILDCCDGYNARKYNQETLFGDLLDHYSDYIYYFCLFYILLVKINWKNRIVFIIIFVFLVCTSIVHIGCTENYYIAKKGTNTQLSKLKNLCKRKELIHYIKYFGPGTLHVFIVMTLLFYIKK